METVAWLRMSEDDTEGIEEQRRLLHQFAANLGLTIDRIFEANDRSAFKGLSGSAEYEDLLKYLSTNKQQVLIGRERTRLYRDLTDYARLSKITKQFNVRVYAVESGKQSIVFDSISEDLQAVISRNESRKISERVLWKQADLRSQGLQFTGGKRAYGYVQADKSKGIRYGSQVIEHEAAIIREIAKKIMQGESSHSIVDDLNSRNEKNAAGASWTVPKLKDLMTSPRIAGFLTHKGEIVGKGQWPAILDEETWNAVQEIYKSKVMKNPGRPAVSLLAGLLQCGLCHAPMYADRRTNGTEIYRCARTEGGCGKITRQRKWLDEHITDLALNFQAQEIQDETIDVSEELESVTKQLAKIDREIENVRNARDAFEDLQDFMFELNRLRKARKQLIDSQAKKRIEHERAQSFSVALEMSAERWDSMTLEQRRDYIRYWLAPIIILKPKPGPIGPHSILEVITRGQRTP